jgi:PadR family transcriptional regulator, regulatory protein PadR
MSKKDMSKANGDAAEIPRGSLDLLVLRTLHTLGTLHGYAIARRIEQVAGGAMRLSQGAIYPALIRLEQRGLIRTKWGVSETNRKVKFYELTRVGAKHLQAEIESWEQSTAMMARFLGAKP